MMRVRWWNSIRIRLAAATALISAVTLVTVLVVVDQTLSINGREELRRSAVTELRTAVTVYESSGRTGPRVSTDPLQAPPQLRNPPPDQIVSLFDGSTMWAVYRIPSGPLLSLAVSAEAFGRHRVLLLSTFAFAGSVGLAAAIALALISAQSISGRLRRAAAAAVTIADGGCDRIHSSGHDEVAAMSRAVDRMADALTERLEAEKAFTGDVAHELRTPMAALVSAAELLPADPSAELVRHQVARLRKLVDDLLEIARLESGPQVPAPAPYPIQALVPAELVTTPADPTTDPTPDPTTATPGDTLVLAEPRRVERILTNLIANATLHAGSEPRVLIDGHRISVLDDGPGFPAELLAHGPRRFHRHSSKPGSGLGLTICVRHAEAMGGRLELTNRPEGGGRACLLLPPAPEGGTARG